MINIREGLPTLNAVDAEFVTVTGEEKQHIANLPATLEDVKFLRHKKAEPDAAYLQEFKDDIKLDIELGLRNQYEIDQTNVLKKDIDTLTQSNNYFQVTPKLLNKLFKIEELRALCAFHNLKEAIVESIKGSYRPILYTVLLVFSILGTLQLIHIVNSNSPFAFWMYTAVVFAIIWDLTDFGFLIACFCSDKFGKLEYDYEFMKVDLAMEDIKDTKIPLPRIAKLKLKEAKDSELFEGFSIAHPEFKVDRQVFKPKLKLDPVILGVAKDSRAYMICWWDIEKDIDKVKENIRLFKKFKV
jgi:hypothetical protein